MGNPKGLAFRFSIPDDTNPTAAAEVVAAMQNSLLVIAGIQSPLVSYLRETAGLKLPSAPAFGSDVFLRQIGVVYAKMDGVPRKLLPREHSDISEQ